MGISKAGCDDGGECSATCQCNEDNTLCDCACSTDGERCEHGKRN